MNPRRVAPLCICLILLAGFVAAAEVAACNEKPAALDGTCCWNRFNLQEENRVQLAAPTVVDISESNGNILVRGPTPLIIRNGKGNDPKASPCMNHSDWRFAYDELNAMIQNQKTFAPVYFTPGKKAALASGLQNFNLDEYHVIVISLLDHGDINPAYFAIEQRDFGGSYSSCSEPLTDGTLPGGQKGSLVWSTVGFCDGGNDDQCQEILNTDTGATCSYAHLIDEIGTLMATGDPSGKKRLIYYHCVLGTDRTGGVTIGYLQKTMPPMSFADAVTYATHLGTENSMPPWPPNSASQALANAYCLKINGTCETVDDTRIYLPGRDRHTHIPDVQPGPAVTPSVLPVNTPAPAQTPVPAGRYDPTKAGEANF
ncbi:MAG: hypothetical protein OS112_04620 [Methanoregula sp.]|nr:MAG: hypothetical protein OS112_04620 [Methanoregula sp.]